MKISYLLLLFMPFSSFSQNSIRHIDIRGTYIIGSICKEGIIMGADSRNCWFDSRNNIVAYTETAKKIYEYKDLAFAMAGQYAFPDDNLTFNGLFDKFKHSNKRTVQVNTFYNIFLQYAKSVLKKTDYKALQENQFLVAGYNSNTPNVYYYANNKQEHITSFDWLTNNAKDKSIQIHGQVSQMLKSAGLADGTSFTNYLIQNIITKSNEKNIGKIGGSSSIVNIKERKVDWVKNNYKTKYNSLTDYLEAIRKNKIKLFYVSRTDSVMLSHVFMTYIAKHQ